MCLVIDINAIPCVFNSKTDCHPEFVFVKKWLHEVEKTRLVMGGTKYLAELSKMNQYLPYLAELRRARKIAVIDKQKIDDEENRLK